MKLNLFALRASMAAVIAIGSAAYAQGGLDVTVELPDDLSWSLVTDRTAGQSFSREWAPNGQDAISAEWLIAQQKIAVDSGVTAMEFLNTIYELSAGACTRAEHDEPERVRIDGARGVVGRTMCAQRIGEDFGAFSDRLVFVEEGFAYVVTSELRIPPMVVAGVLSFKRENRAASRAAAAAFLDREDLSRVIVRERVRVAN